MINLMYIVLTAMLAFNVSSDVLEGFSQVEEGLSRSNKNISERNEVLYRRLEAFNEQNARAACGMTRRPTCAIPPTVFTGLLTR